MRGGARGVCKGTIVDELISLGLCSKGTGEPMEGRVQGVTWLEFQFSKLPLGAGCRGGMANHWGEAGMSK